MHSRYVTFVLMFIAVIVGALLFNVPGTHAATITVPKPGVPVSLTIPDTDVLITGCVAPNSLVYIADDATTVGTVVADTFGQYSRLLEAQTPDIHNIEVYFEDVDGIASGTTSDLVALAVKTLTTHTANPPPTISHSPNSVSTGSLVTFQGYTCPFASVSVVIDSNVTITSTADTNGYWSTDINSINFVAGAHFYTVSASNGIFTTIDSPKGQFNIIATVPADPVVTDQVDLSAPVTIEAPDDGFRSTTRNVLVTGTGPPNAQIELYVDGILAGSVFSNSLGEWSLTLASLGPQQILTARACDGSACGVLSNMVQVYYDEERNSEIADTGVCDIKLLLEQYRFSKVEVSKGIDIDLEILGEYEDVHRYDVVIDWGDIAVDHQTLDQNKIRLYHTYSNVGNFNGSVSVQDEADCQDIVYFSVQVIAEEQSNYAWLFVLVALFAAVSWLARKDRESA